MAEYRRILLDGNPTLTELIGGELVAADGRTADPETATHLAPVSPSKIICVHLNYVSRVTEFMAKLPPAPTYFQKPVSALNGHRGAVVRPERCEWLNYEGEVAIVIGRTCRNIAPADAGRYISPVSPARKVSKGTRWPASACGGRNRAKRIGRPISPEACL